MMDDYENLWDNLSDYLTKRADQNDPLQELDPSNKVRPSTANVRQILNLLFVIDVSGSMQGARIGQVNYALDNIVHELIQKDDPNAQIKIGILTFEETCKWLTPKPLLLEDYRFVPLKASPYLTNYGPAFRELRKKLSRSAFMDPNLGEYFAPVILFITDGEPTDVGTYPAELTQLKTNGWFQQSARYAIAVGEDAKDPGVVGILSQFTDDETNVRCADNPEELCQLIQYVAVRASQIQTEMSSEQRDSSGNVINRQKVYDDKDDRLFSSIVDRKQ